MTPRVVVFAKPPEPGRVKTRLIPALGAQGAAFLHEAMAEDVLANCRAAGLPVTLALAGPMDHPWALRHAAAGCELVQQVQGDLGARMAAALTPGPCLALGIDSPTLPTALLRAAAELPGDAVVGPAFDGGYWLIGWRDPRPELLSGVDWSTERVYAQTHERARAADVDLRTLPFWYDVDTPDGLGFLRNHLSVLSPSVAPHTRAFLAAL